MDHNLEELNLESAIGVEFEHSEDVTVSDTAISLGTNSHDTEIPMEFEHIEEQPMLMDTSNEEVIEFIGDQFSLQGYSMPDNEITDTSAVVSEQQAVSESLVDLQFEQPVISTGSKQEFQIQSKLISVKSTIPSRIVSKKIESATLTSAPRQIAIAPKPPPKAIPTAKAAFGTKQFAIAPKPMTLVGNKTFKKVSLANFVPGNVKGSTVLGQMGKQLIMVPASGTQKIKVIAANTGSSTIQYIKSNNDQAQLIATKNIQATKPVLAKVIVPGQDPSNQPAVITKILPAASAPQTRYVMQQKTVPVGNKVVVTSPTKSPMKITKTHEIITTPKLMPFQTSGTTMKKVVITSNPKQNMVLKTGVAPKSIQAVKGSVVNIQGQPSQIHQVHVPGKGIQYIRLVSNPASPTKSSASAKVQAASQDSTPKAIVFTDSKGNLIQMTTDKLVSTPPPLVLTSASASKVTSKPRQKLVRIAPLTSQSQVMPIIRSTQSLLAPLTVEETPALEEDTEPISEDYPSEDQLDSKEALRAMIAETIPEDVFSEEIQHGEVEVQFERQESEIEDGSNNMDSTDQSDEHPLIVIPSNFMKENEQNDQLDEAGTNNNHILDIEIEGLTSYERPQTPQQLSDSETAPNEQDLSSRPRKACNCTKSQCLKLYCDCFANGEFCNRCNCNNCHNNLENEEQRQKAIRGCLERNPNAFRPKIGKSKTGGPEIIRRHNKGCNCKRSGCLKNYCECYEAKIACSSICKCVGCRNVEETLERGRRREPLPTRDVVDSLYRPAPCAQIKSPSSFMTNEVIEAVCQCLIAAAVSGDGEDADCDPPDPIRDVLDEFAHCLQDIISAAHHPPASAVDEGHA